MSVTLRLEHEVDISRGDMLVDSGAPPTLARRIEAHLIWMSETPLDPSRGYYLKHTTRSVRASIEAVVGRTDLQTLAQEPVDTLQLNDIGRVVLACNQPLFCESYKSSRALGSFIIIDAISNNTVGAGMIIDALDSSDEGGARLPHSAIAPEERRTRLGHSGAVIAFEGAGESERALAYHLEQKLFELGCVVTVIDVDDVADPTRSPALLADIATQCVGLGAITIFSRTLPRPADRAELSRRLGGEHVHTFAAADSATTQGEIVRLSEDIAVAAEAILQVLRDAGVLTAVHQ